MGNLVSMIEDNDPVPTPLTDVVSVDDGFEIVPYNESGADGISRAHQKKVKKVGQPADAEALRLRYTVLDNGFCYAKYKHHNIAWLADFKGGTTASTPSLPSTFWARRSSSSNRPSTADHQCHRMWCYAMHLS